MHKRAFQAPKRTFMHVAGLPPPYFDYKKIDKMTFFKIKIWWGKTCYMNKPHHIFILKTNYIINSFIYQNMVGET